MGALTFLGKAARRVNGARRLWLVYYLATLLFALTAALPLAALLSGNLGHSLWANRMLENFDVGWFSEFAYASGGWPAASYAPTAILAGVIFFILATFLAGGTITLFAGEPGPYDARAFWGGCGRNFARLLRLVVPTAAVYVAVIVLYTVSRRVVDNAIPDSTREIPTVLLTWACSLGALLLLMFVNMVADYARVRLVVDDSRRALRAFLGSFAFVFRNFRAAVGVYAGALALLFVFAALGHFAIGALRLTTAGWLLLMLVAQQIFILGRIWIKLLFYAGETGVYKAFRKAPAPAVEEAAAGQESNIVSPEEPVTDAAEAELQEHSGPVPTNGDELQDAAPAERAADTDGGGDRPEPGR